MEMARGQQRLAEALADARHLLALEPDDANAKLRVAQLCFGAGEFDEAETLCAECLDQEPRWRRARKLRAELWLARGRPEKAAAILDDLLRERGDDFGLMLARAAVHLDMREPERAIPLLEKIVQQDKSRQRTGRHQLALAYEQAGRHADAQRVMREMHQLQESEVLRDALSSRPDDPDVQVRAARAWLAGSGPEVRRGLELLGRLLERHPDHAGAHRALAEYYERAGQPQRAAEHRRRAGGQPSDPTEKH
jgi:predicted Zn-dependent protease